MKHSFAGMALALMLLALSGCDRAAAPTQPADGTVTTTPVTAAVPMPKNFAELVAGRDFELVEPAPATPSSGAPIEVAEAFSYACSHCAHFEPFLEPWRANLPDDVRFEAVPMPFNEVWTEFARAHYAASDLDITARTHGALFKALHEDKSVTIDGVDALVRWFAETGGVDAARFRDAMTSPDTDARIEGASSRAQRWGVDSTPTLVIGNRYKVYGFADSEGGYARTIAVADLVISHLRDAGES